MVAAKLTNARLIGGRKALPSVLNRGRGVASTQVAAEANTPEVKSATGKAKIYIGKGRFLEDDPTKYPDRTVLTGGFAGGEVGLKQFVSQIDGTVAKPDANSKSSDSKASSRSKGGLYVGKGRYLPYDPKSNESRIAKSTGRDSSLVGGFAGGEVGLRKYVETGEVPFASEGSRARRQQSSLIVAGVVSAAAVTGGILLTDVTDIGEQIVSGSTSVTPAALAGLDDNTKLLLETAILLVGVVATVVGARAIIGSITNNLREGATRLGTLALFWIVVFIAARFILDSP